MEGETQMKLVVHSVINRYVLCATVLHSNALLRFRFERPLDLDYVIPGRDLTILAYEFSRLTHVVNCRVVLEANVMQQKTPGRPLLL